MLAEVTDGIVREQKNEIVENKEINTSRYNPAIHL